MKTGIELIAEERQEQIEKHGRTVENDVFYNSQGQLKQAIMMLIANLGFINQGLQMPKEALDDLKPDGWSYPNCQKMLNKPEVDQLRIIGAFAAAEIDRKQASPQNENNG